MQRFLLSIAVFGLACFCPWGVVSAQPPTNWAEQMFESKKHDFGVVARGADVYIDIPMKNPWNETVHVAEVRSGCGCASGTVSKNTLKSLETGSLRIALNTRQYTRERNTNITVIFDQPAYVQVIIPIRAYIRTDVVMDPGVVNFGPTVQGDQPARTVKIDYAGRGDWTIKEVLTRNPHIQASVKEVSRNAAQGRVQYELFVKLAKETPLGDIREKLLLVTDDASNPNIPLIVEGRVEPEYLVTTPPTGFGTMKPGEKNTIQVVVRGRKPFAIEKFESDSGSQAYQVQLPPKEKQQIVHVLRLTVAAPEKAGAMSEKFSLTITGKDKPVEFSLAGKVTDPSGVAPSPEAPKSAENPTEPKP